MVRRYNELVKRVETEIDNLVKYSLESRRLMTTSTHRAGFSQDNANQLLKKVNDTLAGQLALEQTTKKQISDLTAQVSSLASQVDNVNRTIQFLLKRRSTAEGSLDLETD
jgi:RNA processing factor Prp31